MTEIASALAAAHHSRAERIKTIKVSILGLLSLGLITLTWYLMRTALYGGQPVLYWGWVAGAIALWIASICFFMLVNPHRWLFAAVNIWGLAAYLLLMPKDLYVALGGILFFLISILFQKRLQMDEKNQVNFSVRRSISGSLAISSYAFLAVIGFNIYHSTSQDFKDNPQVFYDRIGQIAAESIPFVSENFVPGTNLNQSLDEYLTSKNDIGQGQLPPAQERQFLAQYREQFLQQFGVDASGNETLAVIITRITTDKVKEVLGRFERFFPLIFALIIIGLLRTFSFIFNWLTIFITWLLFKLLLAMKFFRINKVTVEVDKLGL